MAKKEATKTSSLTLSNVSLISHKALKNNWGLILFLACLFTMRSSFADWYRVPSGSMLPTIEIGDQITVNKMAYDLRIPFTEYSLMRTGEPKRGDIVVFQSAAADELLIKRVIGLPGDTITMENEILTINGEPLSYSVTSDNTNALLAIEQLGEVKHAIRIDKTRSGASGNFASVLIPADYYLMMGDNRRNSADSRFYGLVPRSELKGKAHHVAYSLDYDDHYLPRSERFGKSLYR
ncbi:signal peptidase I [Pseudoalteromonas sp. BDTF-M6]|uniref:signal peptidase I n=1 Tax=Pseudoalteromonas sp. BDTF-M6 TaxID=2796132 RepID=UPI001BAE986E|nr:signal peptidase I [Pseudoalteromonas sp. BDTF-M6]MBS3796511.1 signal peptidase I [Pseudoalteromonas sp. BDTF-M6]